MEEKELEESLINLWINYIEDRTNVDENIQLMTSNNGTIIVAEIAEWKLTINE